MYLVKEAAEFQVVKCPKLEGSKEEAAWLLLYISQCYVGEKYGFDCHTLSLWIIHVIKSLIISSKSESDRSSPCIFPVFKSWYRSNKSLLYFSFLPRLIQIDQVIVVFFFYSKAGSDRLSHFSIFRFFHSWFISIKSFLNFFPKLIQIKSLMFFFQRWFKSKYSCIYLFFPKLIQID